MDMSVNVCKLIFNDKEIKKNENNFIDSALLF